MALIARRGSISAVAVALMLLLPGAALSASKPIAQFHDHFTDSFSADVCGVEVDGTVVLTDNFFVYADESFKDASSVILTFTNPDTGKSVTVSSAGTVTGTAIIDETAGTITFVTSFKGLPEKIQTANGRVLLRDAGVITFRDTFDLETGEFLGTEVTVSGPHPEADSDFTLFCETIVAALT
jgi:hypothetical protein